MNRAGLAVLGIKMTTNRDRCQRLVLAGWFSFQLVLYNWLTIIQSHAGETPTRGAPLIHRRESKLSVSAFMALLKAIVDEGDLRNITRFSEIIHAPLKLEPVFLSRPDRTRILARVAVLPATDIPQFKPPTFRFWFSIQDTLLPPTDGTGKSIAMMSIPWIGIDSFIPGNGRINCVTRQDLERSFGEPVASFPGTILPLPMQPPLPIHRLSWDFHQGDGFTLGLQADVGATAEDGVCASIIMLSENGP